MQLNDARKAFLAGAVISLSTLIAYWNIQNNNLISYDDVKYLIDNEHVRSGLSLASIKWALTATYDANWFPLTWLSHMLDMTLFGSHHLGHHLENLFLHITNALLLMTILTRLTGHIWRAAAVALLFALHPMHVESVVWAAERKDLLSTLFFLLTLRSYIKYATHGSSPAYWTALFLYLCGLASKPMLVSLPFILLLLDFWPLGRFSAAAVQPRAWAAIVREKVPFALLSFASCILTFIVQRSGGAVNDAAAQPLFDNSLHAFFNYMTYLRMTFWPAGLGALYPYIHDLPLVLMAAAGGMLLAVSLAAITLRRRIPYFATGWFWFLITTAPVAGFVRIGVHSVADRYTYIPSIGIFIAMVWLLSDILAGRRYEKTGAVLITLAVMLPLGAATWQQTTYWKDSATLFEHNLDVTKNNWVAHGNLGAELLKYHHPKQALWHLEEAVRINPDSYAALFNLGVALNRQGDKAGASTVFRNAIKLNPSDPRAYFEAGKTSYESGDTDAAVKIQAALIPINRDMADALKRYYGLLENARTGSKAGRR
jgi:hypothetical protein